MSVEVETLSELYRIMKQYIPSKDRQEAADNIISVLVDSLSDEDFAEFSTTDTPLKRAAKEYSVEADEVDESDDHGYEE